MAVTEIHRVPAKADTSAATEGIVVRDHRGLPCTRATIGWMDSEGVNGKAIWRGVDGDGAVAVSALPTAFVTAVEGQSVPLLFHTASLPAEGGRRVAMLPAPTLTGRLVGTVLPRAQPLLFLRGLVRDCRAWPEPLAAALIERHGPIDELAVTIDEEGQFEVSGVAPGQVSLELGGGYRFRDSSSPELVVRTPVSNMRLVVETPVFIAGSTWVAAGSFLAGERVEIRCHYQLDGLASSWAASSSKLGDSFSVLLPRVWFSPQGALASQRFYVEVRHADYGILVARWVANAGENPVNAGSFEVPDPPLHRFRLRDAKTKDAIAGGIGCCGSAVPCKADASGVVALHAAPGSVIELVCRDRDIAFVEIAEGANVHDVAMFPLTALEVHADVPPESGTLRLLITLPGAWRSARARSLQATVGTDVGDAPHTSEQRFHREVLDYPVPASGTIRVRGFIACPTEVAGDHVVRVDLVDGYGSAIDSAEVPLVVHGDTTLRLRAMRMPRDVAGRVVDRSGGPLPGARVRIGQRAIPQLDAESDRDGRFVFSGYWGERPDVTVSFAGRTLGEVVGSEAAGASYIMDVAKAVTVEVLDANGARTDAEVTLVSSGGRAWHGQSRGLGVTLFDEVPAIPLRAVARIGDREATCPIAPGERQTVLTVR